MDQDKLYNQALGALQAMKWDVRKISRTQYELVALWRMEADINNGGFLQFLGNRGLNNYQVTLQTLQNTGALLCINVCKTCLRWSNALKMLQKCGTVRSSHAADRH